MKEENMKGPEEAIKEAFKNGLKGGIYQSKADMKRCLDNVLKDFPEFSEAKHSVTFDIFQQEPLVINTDYSVEGNIANPRISAIRFDITYNLLGVYLLADDDCKEGAISHELGEISHYHGKGLAGFKRNERFIKTDKHYSGRRYIQLVEQHADLTAARRGYAHKLMKVLTMAIPLLPGFVNMGSLRERINNLKSYMGSHAQQGDVLR